MIHIVEDEENIRKLLSINLTKRGHEVVEAYTAEEAIKQLEVRDPQLMLLNIRLPGLSGLDLLDHLDECTPSSTPDFPVVLITATMVNEEHTLRKYPRIIRIITKPFDINELIEFVHDTLIAK